METWVSVDFFLFLFFGGRGGEGKRGEVCGGYVIFSFILDDRGILSCFESSLFSFLFFFEFLGFRARRVERFQGKMKLVSFHERYREIGYKILKFHSSNFQKRREN